LSYAPTVGTWRERTNKNYSIHLRFSAGRHTSFSEPIFQRAARKFVRTLVRISTGAYIVLLLYSLYACLGSHWEDSMNTKLFCASAYLFSAAFLFAQSTPPSGSAPNPQARRGGVPPCMQQAGIDPSVMEQFKSIQREMHSQVQGVCSNTSLSPEQKHQQVKEIRQQARQKMDGLISPEQQKKLTACRQERGEQHPGMGGAGAGGDGCGEWHGGKRPIGAPGTPPTSQPSPQN